MKKTEDYILLDTSYLIVLSDKQLKEINHINETSVLETKLSTNNMFDHFSGDIGRAIMILESRLKSIERALCQQMKALSIVEDEMSGVYQGVRIH